MISSPASQRLAQASWKWLRFDPTLLNRARVEALVEAGERVFGGGERIFQRIQRAPIRDFMPRIRGLHASSAPPSAPAICEIRARCEAAGLRPPSYVAVRRWQIEPENPSTRNDF